jgi:ferritin
LDLLTRTLAHEQLHDPLHQRPHGSWPSAEKDHATKIFLEWYVTEQVEEEENDNDIIAQLKLIKDNPQGLMMLDRELAGRAATVPTDFSKGVEAAISDAAAGP